MDFQNSFTAGKPGEFSTKPIQCFPPYFRYVAALPCKVRS